MEQGLDIALSRGVPHRLGRLKARLMRRMTSAWRPHELYLQRPAGGAHDVRLAVDAFARWCQGHEGAVCRVALSSRWVLSAAMPSAMPGREQMREAIRQWSHYHDVDEATMASEWVCRQARAPGVAIACATPLALIDGLTARARTHGIDLAAVQPWWTRAVETWLAVGDTGASSASADGAATLHLVEPGFVTHVQTSLGETPRQRGARQCLSIWSGPLAEYEVPMSASAQACVTLPVPLPRSEKRDEALEAALLWDHAALAPVLSGQTARQAAACREAA